ncbi:MAG: nickel pincer cofactor biosynthesis protein LarC [Cyanobacteriota bacterium]|nr:nickel pincer cofactor biosynthesis protein LarC [Cyanobacteriota bacterium]
MTKIAYLDCPTGIAGDMCLGALVDGGVPLDYLIEQLKKLGLDQEYQLNAQKVHRNGQTATQMYVGVVAEHTFAESHHSSSTHQGRHLPEIERLIQQANLPDRAERWSLQVFRQLAAAEGAVHGIAPERVHFHEVGAVDAIVDIVGTCLGLDWLEIEQLYCSALPTGGGTVTAAHGRLPVPTPAVLKLWEMRKVPIYSNGILKELVTPTGAAIATTLARDFGFPPAFQLERVGLGAGSRDLPIPNILRLWLGVIGWEETRREGDGETERRGDGEMGRWGDGESSGENELEQETIAILETQIDDLSPQAIGYTLESLLSVGALDVFTQAIAMKKSRPGILLTVLCHPQKVAACETVLWRETTTLGIRHRHQQRTILPREIHTVETPYGTVRVKVTRRTSIAPGGVLNAQPEYDDCAELARTHNKPWREIHQLALQAWETNWNREIVLNSSSF